MPFVQFQYYDNTSDTPAIAAINAGSNSGRVGILAALLNSGVTTNSLTWGGTTMLPALVTGAGASGAWKLEGYGLTGLGAGNSAIAANMTPVGVGKNLLAATFDGITSIVSTAVVGSGGIAGHPSATVTTVAGDTVVLLGNDLGAYDPTITGTTTGGVTTSVLAGSGFFIGLQATATGTSTTVGGTFSGGARNWQGAVYVLRGAGGGAGRLFRNSLGGRLSGIGTTGPFFQNPLNRVSAALRRTRGGILIPA